MYQHWLINCTNLPYQCEMLIIAETGCWLYGNPIISLQFFCKSKTLLKLKIILQKAPFYIGLKMQIIYCQEVSSCQGFGMERRKAYEEA